MLQVALHLLRGHRRQPALPLLVDADDIAGRLPADSQEHFPPISDGFCGDFEAMHVELFPDRKGARWQLQPVRHSEGKP